MKKILIVVGMILALGLTAAGSFYGGMRYQSNQAEQARSAFVNDRGGADSGQLPGDGSGLPGSGAGPAWMDNGQAPTGQFPGEMGSGTAGVVKTIEGNVMTLSTAQNVTTVDLSKNTPVQQSVTGTLADLQPGMRVRIIGQADQSGAITANQIVILDGSQAGEPVFGQMPAGDNDPAPMVSDPAATQAESEP